MRAISAFRSSKERRERCIRASISATASIEWILLYARIPKTFILLFPDSQGEKVVLNRLFQPLGDPLRVELYLSLPTIGGDNFVLCHFALAGRRFCLQDPASTGARAAHSV